MRSATLSSSVNNVSPTLVFFSLFPFFVANNSSFIWHFLHLHKKNQSTLLKNSYSTWPPARVDFILHISQINVNKLAFFIPICMTEKWHQFSNIFTTPLDITNAKVKKNDNIIVAVKFEF